MKRKTKTKTQTDKKLARINVQAQPGAKRTEVVGPHGDAIKIRVQAPPVDGKANEELIRFLAETLGVARANVSLSRGETSRTKSFLITGLSEEEVLAILLPPSRSLRVRRRRATVVFTTSEGDSKMRQLVLSAFMLFVCGAAQAAIVKKDIDYNLAGKKYEGYIAYDDSVKTPRPGILVAHNWMGVTNTTKEVVDRLAGMGYVAMAVDIYGKGVRPKDTKEAGELATMYKKDRLLLRTRMREGYDTLKKQAGVDKNHIAVIGYCFGGTSALELARSGADFKSLVSFHGGLDSPKPEDGKKIKAKVLILHGADDPYNPAADVAAFEDEMRKANVDWQLIKYGGAVHSFTEKEAGNDNSKGAAYNERADKRSWQEMEKFLKETI